MCRSGQSEAGNRSGHNDTIGIESGQTGKVGIQSEYSRDSEWTQLDSAHCPSLYQIVQTISTNISTFSAQLKNFSS